MIGLLAYFISFYFGYAGKPWKYIFISIMVGVGIGFITNSEDLLMLAAFGLAIPMAGLIVGVALLLAFGMAIVLHFAAWWFGKKIKAKKG